MRFKKCCKTWYDIRRTADRSVTLGWGKIFLSWTTTSLFGLQHIEIQRWSIISWRLINCVFIDQIHLEFSSYYKLLVLADLKNCLSIFFCPVQLITQQRFLGLFKPPVACVMHSLWVIPGDHESVFGSQSVCVCVCVKRLIHWWAAYHSFITYFYVINQ